MKQGYCRRILIFLLAAAATFPCSRAAVGGAVQSKPLRTTKGKPKIPLSSMSGKRRVHEDDTLASSAVVRRSFTKYLSSDPLWTAQISCTGACWLALLLGLAPSLRGSNGSIRAALLILAAKNYIGLLCDVKGLVQAASRASPDPEVIRASVKELMGTPGAASYALYSLAVLLLVDTIPYTIWPLVLREAWTTFGVIQDVLYITGILKEKQAPDDEDLGGEKEVEGRPKRTRPRASAFGPARRPPPVLFSFGLVVEVGVGVALLAEHVLGRKKLAWRSVLGLILYSNFLLARGTQIPKLEEGKPTVTRAAGLLISTVLDDLELSAQELSTGLTGAVEKVAPGLLKVLDPQETE